MEKSVVKCDAKAGVPSTISRRLCACRIYNLIRELQCMNAQSGGQNSIYSESLNRLRNLNGFLMEGCRVFFREMPDQTFLTYEI